MTEFLSNDILAEIDGYSALSRGIDDGTRYTKAEQFGDIDATIELDIFQDEWSSHFAN